MVFSSFPWAEFALLAGAHFLALLSPGPDFLLLLRNALRHGRQNGIGIATGIALANGATILLALAGFSLVQQSVWLLNAFKWAAAAYLAWIGWMFIRDSLSAQTIVVEKGGADPAAAGFWRGFGAGFLSAALNPKNALFYFGLFTLMVSATTAVGIKLVYGVWMTAVVFTWDAALVFVLSHSRSMAVLRRWLPLVERGAGVLLMAAAVGLVLWRV